MRSGPCHPFRVTVRILLLAVSALAIFGGTAALCALALAWVQNNSVAGAGIVTLGVVCGLIAWLFIAVFHIRKETRTLAYDDRATFLPRLRRELEELGYEANEGPSGKIVFKPGFTAYLVGGAIHVSEQPGCVVVTGPAVFVEMLRKRMKIHSHITNMQQSINDSRVRQGRHLLRRVEIDLRVTAEQWQRIYDNVISVLAVPEAEVVCEVHILAQNENGILDAAVEERIREPLRQLNIVAEIRKETRPSGAQKLVKVTN